MKTLLKRFGAYFIDYLIVTVIIYGVMLLPFVNPKKEEYNTKYNEVVRVNEQYRNNEISNEEFNEAIIPIAYDLYRLNTSYVIVSTICFIGYFVIFQFLYKGQTIGKKLFKLRIVSTNDKPLTMANFFVRALILYNILIPIIELIIVYTMSPDNYYGLYQNINLVSYIIMYITLFFMLVRTDGRGLHDILANTVVNEEEEKQINITEVKEIKEENKEQVEKKTTSKKKTPLKKKSTSKSKKTEVK